MSASALHANTVVRRRQDEAPSALARMRERAVVGSGPLPVRLAGSRSFRGRFDIPGDKSISHRLALFGSLAEGETEITNFSSAADCASTLACLGSLGVA